MIDDDKIRVLVVDDHPLFRRGLTALLSSDDGLLVIGDAADAGEAQRKAEALQPDVILLDNHLPAVTGVDALPALVHHHLALVLELLGREPGQEMPHAVRLEPERKLEMARRQGLVVVRAVVPGRSVGDAADLLQVAEVVVGSDVLAALEEHVLEKVREAGSSGLLVLGTDVVPEIDRDERQGGVAVEDDPQAVGELVAREVSLRRRRGEGRERGGGQRGRSVGSGFRSVKAGGETGGCGEPNGARVDLRRVTAVGFPAWPPT